LEFQTAQKIKPIGVNVLLEMIEDDITNDGLALKNGPRSLIIAPSYLDRNRVVKAKVIEVGPLIDNLKTGNTVLVPLLSGIKIGEWRVVHEDLILAVIDE